MASWSWGFVVIIVLATVAPVPSDVVVPKSRAEGALVAPDAAFQPPGIATPGPGPSDLSEFFMGTVGVAIFLVESNGSAYDWSDTEVTQTLNGIYAGLTWWGSVDARARLSFKYEVYPREPSTYEPIQLSIDDDWQWITEILSNRGYTDSGTWGRARHFNRDVRARLGTDWAYSIFVADSEDAVEQGLFTGGGYAHAYFGGPWVTMSRYSSWAYNSSDYYRAVPAHETGHIFYATDEYDGVSQSAGYLNCPDRDYSTGIMNQNTLSVSESTRCQIGWIDSDGDGIFDILDEPPDTTLTTYIVEPTEQCRPRVAGIATVVPLANANPYGPRNDVTISRITLVEVRVDAGAWQTAEPDDGAFDGVQEAFSAGLPNLLSGTHAVEARTHNTEGNVDPSPALTAVTVSGPLCSAVDTVPLYATRSSIAVSAKASNESAAVELWHRRGSDSFQLYAADTAAPWQWIFDTSAVGGDGSYAFYSIAIDADGNRETPPAEPDATTTVDTGLPVSSVDPLPFAVSADFTVTASAYDGLGISYVELWYLTGASSTRHHLDVTLPWSFRVRVADLPADGVYGFYSIATDVAGNVEVAPPLPDATTIVDTSPPVVVITAPSPGGWTPDRRVVVAWAASDAGAGIEGFEVSLDGGPFEAIGNVTSHAYDGLPDGGHVVGVVAVDGADHRARANVTFSVDATPPSLAMVSPAPEQVLLDTNVRIEWTATDRESGISGVEVRLDDGPFVPVSEENHTFPTVPDGVHVATVRVRDAVGHVQEASVTFRVHANPWTGGGPYGWIPTGSLVALAVVGVVAAALFAKRRRRPRIPSR